jgi:hypothetical protein
MKEEEVAIPQSRERMFVDLTIEDDNEESEEESGFRIQSESEEDEFSLSSEDESLISDMDDNGIKRHHDPLMNSGRSRVVG